jgi:hypothetical protein
MAESSLSQMAQVYQLVYWLGAIMLLTCGTALMSVALSFIRIAKDDALYLAFIPIFLADVSLVLNFLPRDLRNIVVGELESSTGWCQFSAIWTITACIALNINTVAVAYYTRELVFDRLERDKMKKQLIYITGAGWALGFTVAMVWWGQGEIGNFRGIYCCFEQVSSLNIALPFFICTTASLIAMIFLYRQAFVHVKAISDGVARRAWKGELTSTRKSSDHVVNLFKLSAYMVGNFYVCWTLVSLLAIIESFGITYPVGFDVLAGWLLKLQPILDSIMIIKGFRRMIFRKMISQQGQSSAYSPRKFEVKRSLPSNSTQEGFSSASSAVRVASLGEIRTEGNIGADEIAFAHHLACPDSRGPSRSVDKNYLNLQEGIAF